MIEERDEEMRSQYYDPIENFPDKIHQLMNALDRVCAWIFLSMLCEFFLFRSIWISKILYRTREMTLINDNYSIKRVCLF
jgi:hypothetical protein